VIPKESKLHVSKEFRALKPDFDMHQELIAQASTLIPEIDARIGPIRHRLSALQIEEMQLKPLELKLNEIDVQERIETHIVSGHIQKLKTKKQKASKDRSDKELAEKLLRNQEKNRADAIKSKELWTKRRALMDALRSEMHEVLLTTSFEKRYSIMMQIRRKRRNALVF
jgi:hypothetical protein